MEKIDSFKVNHLKLLAGIYISRKDKVGEEVITTFDIRMTAPNQEPVINIAEMHTIEHLGATYLRNDKEFSSKVIYFGPMGCRTGFYLILAGDYESPRDILPLISNMCSFIIAFDDEVPGASARDCGNYLDMNLPMAKHVVNKFYQTVFGNLTLARMQYPED